MSDGRDEPGFLSRWSRRKQAARTAPVAEPGLVPGMAPGMAPELMPELMPDGLPELPPVESLGAASDYAVFLRKGVSALVQQQALRKAWTSDAGIAAFRGMAEYDWDFNAVGYGRLRATDNVAELLRAVLSSPPQARAAPDAPEPAAVRQSLPVERVIAEAEPAPGIPDQPIEAPASVGQPVATQPPVVQPGTDGLAPDQPEVRRHGSARPA